jgi:hypothetical protein
MGYNADNDRRVERDPADTGQGAGTVTLLTSLRASAHKCSAQRLQRNRKGNRGGQGVEQMVLMPIVARRPSQIRHALRGTIDAFPTPRLGRPPAMPMF